MCVCVFVDLASTADQALDDEGRGRVLGRCEQAFELRNGLLRHLLRSEAHPIVVRPTLRFTLFELYSNSWQTWSGSFSILSTLTHSFASEYCRILFYVSALSELHKTYILSHRSKLEILAKCRHKGSV